MSRVIAVAATFVACTTIATMCFVFVYHKNVMNPVAAPEFFSLSNSTVTVPGANGTAGPAGPKGEPGDAGERGLQGLTGETGAAGADGQPGATGAGGATGGNGRNGTHGANGASPQGSEGPTAEVSFEGGITSTANANITNATISEFLLLGATGTPIPDYEVYQVDITFDGTAPCSLGTFPMTLVKLGYLVFLYSSKVTSCTTTQTGSFIASTVLPTRFRPSKDVGGASSIHYPLLGATSGAVTVSNIGIIRFRRHPTGTYLTGNSLSIFPFSFIYSTYYTP